MNHSRGSVRWDSAVPEELRRLSTLPKPDYADFVTAVTTSAPRRSPEEWVVAFHRGAPEWVRRLARAPDDIAGLVVGSGDGWALFEEVEPSMTTQYVCLVEGERVSLAFFIRYERRSAAFVWPLMSQIHRRVAVSILREIVLETQP
jgi:hypothetical protein